MARTRGSVGCAKSSVGGANGSVGRARDSVGLGARSDSDPITNVDDLAPDTDKTSPFAQNDAPSKPHPEEGHHQPRQSQAPRYVSDGRCLQDMLLRQRAEDLIECLQSWAIDLDLQAAQLDAREAMIEYKERRLRLAQNSETPAAFQSPRPCQARRLGRPATTNVPRKPE